MDAVCILADLEMHKTVPSARQHKNVSKMMTDISQFLTFQGPGLLICDYFFFPCTSHVSLVTNKENYQFLPQLLLLVELIKLAQCLNGDKSSNDSVS